MGLVACARDAWQLVATVAALALVVVCAWLFRVMRTSQQLRLQLIHSRPQAVIDRWIAGGGAMDAALETIERHGLLTVMTPGMVSGFCSALEESIRAEAEREVNSAWEQMCNEAEPRYAGAGP